MKLALSAIAIFVALVCSSDTATAANFRITHTGTLSIGTDYEGVLGVAGSDLTGLSFRAIYDFTYPGGSLQSFDPPGNAFSSLYVLSPARTLVTIGDNSFAWNTAETYFLREQNSDGSHDIEITSVMREAHQSLISLSYVYSPLAFFGSLNEIDKPFRVEAPEYSSYEFNIANNSDGSLRLLAYGTIGSTHIELTAVPEPAGWAILTVGFGMTGLFARGTKRHFNTNRGRVAQC